MWMPGPLFYPDRPMTRDEFTAIREAAYSRQKPARPEGELPPAPRARLDEPVTVELEGTVAEAARALLDSSGREWLLSLPGDSASRTAHLAAAGIPLWQALDQLLGLYGYDWGVAHETVVLWPAFDPPRARPETPDGDPLPRARIAAIPPPTAISEPLPVEDLLATRPLESWFFTPTVDPRLRGWRVVGRLAAGDTARLVRQVADSLCAIVQGPADRACIRMGAHMWLDAALKGAPDLARRLTEKGVTLSPDMPNPLVQAALMPLFTDQQWELMELGGLAIIWFRELPAEAAQTVVLALQTTDPAIAGVEGGSLHPGDLLTDWSRPQDMYVRATWKPGFQVDRQTNLYSAGPLQLDLDVIVPCMNGTERNQR